jgi:hypothetical protein
MYQMVTKYIKYTNIFPPKFDQIGIFGLNINHLATLLVHRFADKYPNHGT